jgi:transcriptional regulator with XRE-family HTH domain
MVPAMNHPHLNSRPVGEMLREWRQRRRLSQLDFAGDAEISTKHLSFVETGRALPSREMLMRLVELLEVPLRERNAIFLAAGFAPIFAERPLDDPAMTAAREAVQLILKGHEPYPALAIDRHWNMVAANAVVAPLLGGADPELLRHPINVLRLSLHPRGIAPMIVNLPQWRGHLLARLRRQVDVNGDPESTALIEELSSYPATAEKVDALAAQIAIPLQLRSPLGILNFISTTTVFGTPTDITLSELAVEAFFPADGATAAALRNFVAQN